MNASIIPSQIAIKLLYTNRAVDPQDKAYDENPLTVPFKSYL